MDVVLLKDIEKLGTEGAVVRVKPGFARNYLIPRGLAARADAQTLKTIEETKRQRQRKADRAKAEAESVKQTLQSRSVTLTLSLGTDGKAFGAVTAHDIFEALERAGVVLEKHAIVLEQPIKALGIYEVPVRLHPDVSAIVKVSVVKV